MKLIMSIFVFILMLQNGIQAKTVYIFPIGGLDVNKYFYDPYSYRDEVAKPFCRLREALEEAHYDVKFTEDGANLQDFVAIIALNGIEKKLLSNLKMYPKEKCLLFVFEPHVVMPSLYESYLTNIYGKIFVMFDEIIDNEKYYKLYYPQPRLEMIDNLPEFTQKKLCTMISGNKDSGHAKSLYGERRKVISFFENLKPGVFDLYGFSWNMSFRDWKGAVLNKWEVLKNYRFSFCYENMGDQKGYITEKIFDSLVAGCVPIYLGATNITDYVPKDCFIDRRAFSSESELLEFLESMDQTTYEGYIEAIRRFLKSPQAQLFSIDHFVNTILNEISQL